jgi:hypothetical protein
MTKPEAEIAAEAYADGHFRTLDKITRSLMISDYLEGWNKACSLLEAFIHSKHQTTIYSVEILKEIERIKANG